MYFGGVVNQFSGMKMPLILKTPAAQSVVQVVLENAEDAVPAQTVQLQTDGESHFVMDLAALVSANVRIPAPAGLFVDLSIARKGDVFMVKADSAWVQRALAIH